MSNIEATTQDHVTAFRDAMQAMGISFDGPLEADGRFHRVNGHGDSKGRRNVWYILHLDVRPSGAFGSLRLYGDQKFKWSATGTKPLSPEERHALREKVKADKARAEREERERQERAAVSAQRMWDAATEEGADEHPYLRRKKVKALGARVGVWVKESAPDPQTGEVKERRIKGALLIPIRDSARNIVSLQAIFAEPVKIAGEPRGKDFVYGGRKRGCWSTIGKPTEVDGVLTIAICEGFATGGSVHSATGLGVVVAFDSGNLKNVAREVRRLIPGARIVIIADNDQFTLKPVENPGLTQAREAAEAVAGLVACPTFKSLDGKPTDFNDLAATEGEDEVRRQINAVLSPKRPKAEEPTAPGDEPPMHTEIPEHADGEVPAVYYDEMPTDQVDEHKDTGGYFTILGHDRDRIFFYQHEMKMVVERGMADWSDSALTAIAPLHWWEMNFPGEKGLSKKMAVNWLQRTAFARGFFDPSMRRGRGAWRDDGRTVFHFGNKITVDGVIMDVAKIDSKYVYEQGIRLRMPAVDPMSDADGRKIVELAKQFRWSRPASAILLVGWCALAPLCGALKWRPHIWLTGGTGSGKSTIQKDFVSYLMNGASVYAQGNSTEAGIRQHLKSDALPVLFDESEQNDEKEANRMQGVIALIRQSSTESEAQTFKGTVGGTSQKYITRSMFCLASVSVGLKHQADFERLAILSLRPKRDDEDASGSWDKLRDAIYEFKKDADLPARLMRRSLDLLPTTMQNIDIFARVAAKHFGSQREGDQFGAMLAGAWSLVSARLATEDEAAAMIGRYDWSDYVENSKTEESTKALSALLGALIRLQNGSHASVYELVAAAAGIHEETCDIDARIADGVLRRHGMLVKFSGKGASNATLMLANMSLELPKLLTGTPYAADPIGQLGRVKGSYKTEPQSFHGLKSRSLAIPLPLIFDRIRERVPGEDEDEELPF